MRKLLHNFILWFPLGVFGIFTTVASTWDEVRDWIAAKAPEAVLMLLTLPGMLIAGLVIAVWVGLALLSVPPEEQTKLETLADKLPNEPPVTSVEQPNSPLSGLYVGIVIASAGRLKSEGFIELAIRAYNGTGRTISLSQVRGRALMAAPSINGEVFLTTPLLASQHTPPLIADKSEFIVVLHQRVAPEQIDDVLADLPSALGVSIGLHHLAIVVRDADDSGNEAALPLWDGVSLRQRNDVITGRIIEARGFASLRVGQEAATTR